MTPLAVAWDIDGTLIDSEPLHHRALVETCAKWGVDLKDLPEHFFRGIHMGDVWSALRERMPPDLAMEEWLAGITDFYVGHKDLLEPVPQALETVDALASKGIRQVCISNSNRAIVNANLDALKIEPIIEFSLSLDDVLRGKPDPFPYAFGCKRLELATSRVIAVEDSLAGIQSAHSAGLPVLNFSPTLQDGGLAAARIDSLTQVLGYFS